MKNVRWMLYQNDLGCGDCILLIPHMRGVGQPCPYFGELNDIDECARRLVVPPTPVELERIPVD